MDRTKAKKLLNKKGWTGKEVGQAYLYSLSEQQIANKENKKFKPPFTREDLTLMQNSIKTKEQYTIFRSYSALYSALVDGANLAEANIQQLLNGYYRYYYALANCIQADDALKAVQQYPLIMTRTQYNRIKEELIADRKAFKTCFYNVVIEYIEYMAAEPDKAPEAIKKAIEATKKQPCTNSRILSHYNDDMEIGYYTLPDGTRSDEVTDEEWRQKLEDRFLTTHKLTINGEEASTTDTLKHYNMKRLLQLEKLFFEGTEGVKKACKEKGLDWKAKGLSLEDLLKTIEEEITFSGSIKPDKDIEEAFNTIIESAYSGTIWHTATETPELSKYDVLAEPDLMHRYIDFFIDDIENTKQQAEFIEDYPALYKAACKELKKLLPTAAKIKEEDYLQPLLTYGEIQEAGLPIYDYFLQATNRDILDYFCREDTTENMQKRLRIMYSGLAIIEEDSILPSQIAENGDYKENINPYTLIESIDSITDDEDRTEEVQQLRIYLIEPAIKYIYAYNALIDALAAVYDVDCITAIKKDISTIEGQIEGFNCLLYNFYSNVFGTDEEKARKRELIKQVFSPINVEELHPDKKKVKAVKDKLTATYGKNSAWDLVHDLYPLVLEIMGQGEGA